MTNLEKYISLLGEKVDGLLLTSRYARYYGAEFDIAEGVAIVTAKGCRYFTDSRYIESAQNGIRGFDVIEQNRENTYVSLLNRAIADFGVRKLGFEEDALTVAEHTHYAASLGAQLVPYTKAINSFRGTKEPWELELMKKAQAITDKAFAEVLPRIKAGMTEQELQAELIYCLYKNGADGPSFSPIVVSGPNTSLPHGVAGDRVIREGDFITMDFGALYKGYCADMTRTVAVGFVTEEMQTVYDTVLKAQLTALGISKAGVIGRDVDAAARQVITDAGYGEYFGHGYGHGLGLEVHERPSPNGANPDPIPAYAVCSAEPGIYLPGKFGVRIEDCIVFMEDGHENLAHSPKNLIIV